jgi:hypothetical protein
MTGCACCSLLLSGRLPLQSPPWPCSKHGDLGRSLLFLLPEKCITPRERPTARPSLHCLRKKRPCLGGPGRLFIEKPQNLTLGTISHVPVTEREYTNIQPAAVMPLVVDSGRLFRALCLRRRTADDSASDPSSPSSSSTASAAGCHTRGSVRPCTAPAAAASSTTASSSSSPPSWTSPASVRPPRPRSLSSPFCVQSIGATAGCEPIELYYLPLTPRPSDGSLHTANGKDDEAERTAADHHNHHRRRRRHRPHSHSRTSTASGETHCRATQIWRGYW